MRVQDKVTKLIRFKWLFILFSLVLTAGWLANTPPGLLGKADAVGSAVCHRIDTRSFHIGDLQFPLCARCTGQYLGVAIGFGFQWIIARRRTQRPPLKVLLLLGTLGILYGIDGLNSYLHLFPPFLKFTIYEPNNTLRLLTGTGLGLGLSVVLLPVFNQTIWRRRENNSYLNEMRTFILLLLFALFVDLLVLTEKPIFLYPFAIVSTAGIILLLTMVYTMAWVLLLKLENTVDRVSQLVMPVSAGFALAILQIIVIDIIRFTFTGSWEGFHFG